MKWRFFCEIRTYLVVLILVSASCSTELDIPSFSSESNVVVNAVFTDEEKIQTVRLSFATPVNSDSTAPLTNAVVWVEDDLGQIINFIEQSSGVYSTANKVKGEVGRSYKLVFITDSGSGKRYESTPERLIKSPEIDRIYNKFEESRATQFDNSELGSQFYIDSKNTGDAHFFRYEWNDIAQFIAPYPSKMSIDIFLNSIYDWDWVALSNTDTDVDECYKKDSTSRLLLASTLGLTESSIIEMPIRFASMDHLNYMQRYSIEVVQYSVSQKAFEYYRTLKLFNESNGSLFDKQQGTVIGNIQSENDEIVLGYFEVSGISRRREFYNPNELNLEFFDAFLKLCDACDSRMRIDSANMFNPFNHDGNESVPRDLDLVATPVTRTVVFDRNDSLALGEYDFIADRRLSLLRVFFAPRICINCRTRGGKPTKKPDYWID